MMKLLMSEEKLNELILTAISNEGVTMEKLLNSVMKECAVDKKEIVSSLWSLIADGLVTYDINAIVKRA